MPGSDGKLRTLLVGPVRGRFADLSAKLAALQGSRAGPFDACFCAGPFFGIDDDGSGSDSDGGGGGGNEKRRAREARELLASGDAGDANGAEATSTSPSVKPLPLPVFFVDVGRVPPAVDLPPCLTSGNGGGAAAAARDDDEIDLDGPEPGDGKDDGAVDEKEGGEYAPEGIAKVARNLYHLRGAPSSGGSARLSRQVADIVDLPLPLPASADAPRSPISTLVVAFAPPRARIGTAVSAPFESKTSHAGYLGCDLLLSSEWGQGMAGRENGALVGEDLDKIEAAAGAGAPGGGLPLSDIGSYDVAELAAKCRPRYHVAPALTSSPPLHVASLPYRNPPSVSASVEIEYHPSRFLALCPVIGAEEMKALTKARGKAGAKSAKFVHAVGLKPLMAMSRTEATEVKEGLRIAGCPYTDAAYGKDAGGVEAKPPFGPGNIPPPPPGPPPSGAGAGSNLGLSEAQARRIAAEEGSVSNQDFRWGGRGGQRKRPREEGLVDPSNATLFLHGLHRDPTQGQRVNTRTLLQHFGPRGCRFVRHPAGGRTFASSSLGATTRPRFVWKLWTR